MIALRLAALDRRLSARLALPPRSGGARLALCLLAHSGDSPLWLLGAGAAMLWGGELGRQAGWRILAGTLLPGVVVVGLKGLLRRQRPPAGLAGLGALYLPFDRYSFPSGHAARSACVVLLLSPLLPPGVAASTVVWAGLTGLARVALGAHFPSDVLGGWLVGLALGALLRAVT